jgi:SH3-like domain-containing protein
VFVSLKSSEINLRVGPGKEYPVSWTFLKARLPVMLIAEFNEWKKIKFIDETEGWVHQNMISRKNTAIVISPYTILYKYASDAQPIAKIEKDVIVMVMKKDKDWIKVEVNKIKGWIKKQDLWGINED